MNAHEALALAIQKAEGDDRPVVEDWASVMADAITSTLTDSGYAIAPKIKDRETILAFIGWMKREHDATFCRPAYAGEMIEFGFSDEYVDRFLQRGTPAIP